MAQIYEEQLASQFQDILLCQATGNICDNDIVSDMSREQIRDVVRTLQRVDDEQLNARARDIAERFPRDSTFRDVREFVEEEMGISDMNMMNVTTALVTCGEIVASGVTRNRRVQLGLLLVRAAASLFVRIGEYIQRNGGWQAVVNWIKKNVKTCSWLAILTSVIGIAIVLVVAILKSR